MKQLTQNSRLLLVDDDGLVLATFAKGLKDSGYQVQMADSAQAALNLIDSANPPHLAILDIRMPGMSGLEMAPHLKALNIPWIVLSAYDDENYVTQAVDQGALGYLVKPLDVARAIPAIQAALHRAQDLQQCQEMEQRLNTALETGSQVNVAIGVLMERNRLSRTDAYELLRQKARSEQRKVKAVAEELLLAWDRINLLSSSK